MHSAGMREEKKRKEKRREKTMKKLKNVYEKYINTYI